MLGSLFRNPLRRPPRQDAFDATLLGSVAIALPAPAGITIPAPCAVVLVDRVAAAAAWRPAAASQPSMRKPPGASIRGRTLVISSRLPARPRLACA